MQNGKGMRWGSGAREQRAQNAPYRRVNDGSVLLYPQTGKGGVLQWRKAGTCRCLSHLPSLCVTRRGHPTQLVIRIQRLVTGPIGCPCLVSEQGRNGKNIFYKTETGTKEKAANRLSAYISLTSSFRSTHLYQGISLPILPLHTTRSTSTALLQNFDINSCRLPIVASTAPIVYQAEAVGRYTTLYFNNSRVGVLLPYANGPTLLLH